MRSLRSESGFTLAELLVASVLAVVVLGGSVKAFMDMRRASETARGMVDMNQNLRASLSLLTRDLMQAGRNIPTGGIPFPTGSGITIKRPGPPATTPTFPASWSVLGGIAPGAALGPTVNGTPTDVVTMLYDDPNLALSAFTLTSVAADGSSMVVNAGTSIAGATNGIKVGDLIWFTNANGNAIQQVTRAPNGQTVYFDTGTTDSFGFNQRTAASGTIMQIRGGATFPPTSATRVLLVTYYIDSVTVPSNPRLIRQVNFTAGRPIAVGIENLQASYDLVDGSTNPANQKAPVAPNTNAQVRNVNLYLSGRVTMLIGGEQPVRNGATTQVSLRSMSFMDRYK